MNPYVRQTYENELTTMCARLSTNTIFSQAISVLLKKSGMCVTGYTTWLHYGAVRPGGKKHRAGASVRGLQD